MTRNSSSRPVRMPALAFGIAAIAGAWGVADHAAAQAARASQRVTISDLDLSTEAGRHMLDLRIDAAARKACRLEEDRTGMNIRPTETVTCHDQARAATRERVAEAIAGARRGGQLVQVRLERRADLP